MADSLVVKAAAQASAAAAFANLCATAEPDALRVEMQHTFLNKAGCACIQYSTH